MENENTLRGLDRICFFLSRYRLAVFVVILIITGVFSYGTFKIQGKVILQDLLPYDHPYLKLHARFSEVFGSGGSGVAIAVNAKKGDIFNTRTLGKIKRITDEIVLWDEVYRVLTVSIASSSVKVVKSLASGEIHIEPLMFPNIPKNDQEIEELKKNIFSNPSYSGVLVSIDGTAGIILTEMKENIPYERMFKLLRGLVTKYSDDETSVHIVGFPMLMGWIYSLKPQIYLVFGISILGIALVLFIIFYPNLVGMIAPLANAFVLTIWGLGFIGFTGVNFNPLLYVLAFLVGSRMIGNSHQITYRYFEELYSSGGDRLRAGYETMRAMFVPNFAAVVTDAAGFSVLILAKIVLMQHLAIIMTFWMMSIILTGFMVPAICNLIPFRVASERWAKESCQVDWKSRVMMRITRFSIGSGTKYIVGTLIIGVLVLGVWQMSKLKVGDPTPGSPVLWPEHSYNRDQALINKKFNASSENFVLYYEGARESVYDPVVLETFEKFSLHMAEKLPDIYKTSISIIDMAKMVNLTQRDGDQIWYEMPRDEERLTGLLGYIRSVFGMATLGRFFDGPLERAQITLFFSDHTSDNLLRIRDAAYGFFKNHPMKTKNGDFKLAGGRIGMEIALNEEMKRSHVLIDLTVLGAIFIICALFYKSITAGLMLSLPLILANTVAGTYMAVSNIGLSINTLPIAAIGVGVGVDFAIYLYSRFQEEFPLQGEDWNKALIQSVCTSGKAVVYTGVTVILPIMTWYFFSDMKFQAEMGFFLAMIIGTNVILTLTLHPLMIYIIKPKFIRGKESMAPIEAKAVSSEKTVLASHGFHNPERR